MRRKLGKLVIFTIIYTTSLGSETNRDLIYSVKMGNLEKVKTSLVKNVNINEVDKDGNTALIHAAGNGNFEIVKFLVDNGANVRVKNYSGWTASVLAGARGNRVIQKYLEEIEQGIKESRVTGVVLAVKGEVYLGNNRLEVGENIEEAENIYVARGANCDLQIKQSQSESVIRLRGNSVFAFQFREKWGEAEYLGNLKQGSMIVKVGKVFSGERVLTITHNAQIYFNGSSVYEVKVNELGDTNLTVLEGIVKVRVRAKEIEEDTIVENTQEIRKLVLDLEKNEQIIEKGSSIDIKADDSTRILEKAKAETLYKRATWEEFSTEIIPDLVLLNEEKPKIQSLKEKDISEKGRDLAGLTVVEPAKLKNTSEKQEILNLIKSRKQQ